MNVRATPDGNGLLLETYNGEQWEPIVRLEPDEAWALLGQINDWLHPPMFQETSGGGP